MSLLSCSVPCLFLASPWVGLRSPYLTHLNKLINEHFTNMIFLTKAPIILNDFFDLIMSISMGQSLEVFWESFHSFYIFGIQKCKKSTFFVKKYFWVYFYQIEVHVFTNWSM